MTRPITQDMPTTTMSDPDIETEPGPRITHTHLILLAAALAIPGLAWGTYYWLTNKDAADYLQAAEAHTTQGDTKSAIVALKNALQLAPDHAEARYRLGKLYVGIHDYIAAEKELKLAREKGHAAPDLALLLTRTWLALGQPERVIDELPVPEGAAPALTAPLLALRAHSGCATTPRLPKSRCCRPRPCVRTRLRRC